MAGLPGSSCLEKRGSFSWPIKLWSAGESSSLEASSKVDEVPSCRDSAIDPLRSRVDILAWDRSLGTGLVGFWAAAVAARLPFERVTVTALGTPNRAIMGLVVFVEMGCCCARSIVGTGGVLDRELSEGLFLPFDLTATGFALYRTAV